MKSYCTQNKGDCGTCSLVNYGRDCRNVPLDGGGGAAVTIAALSQADFEHEMERARTFLMVEQGGSAYWTGYQRGLRRAYHGENFGTPAEHELWLAAADSEDDSRRQRWQGYRDGLAGKARTAV